MSSIFYYLWILYGVFFIKNSVAMTGKSSFPRTSYTYYLDSGLPSTWYNNNSVNMDRRKMRVLLVIQDYSRNIGFYCGFYSDGSSDFSLSIVAVGSGRHEVVWSTNREYIVRENASLQLTRDEGLILRDSSGHTVWSANASGKPVVGMNLTEPGNFILFGNKGAVLWQSFDHPLDTLLIGQRLYKGWNLVPSFFSNKLRDSPFFATLTPAANFSVFFNTSDGRFLMIHQFALDNNLRNRSGLQYEEAEQKEFVVNLGTFKASNPLDYIEFVKLDQGGRLWRYWFNQDSNGSKIVDMLTQECQSSPNPFLFTEVRDIIYSNINNADAGIVSIRTINECTTACLNICSCTAVVFTYSNDVSDGRCLIPSEIYSAKYNSTGQSNLLAFVKILNPNRVPSPVEEDKLEVRPSSWTTRHRNFLIIISASTAASVAFILLILICLMKLRKNQKEEC